MSKSISSKAFDLVVYLILILLGIVILYPLYFTLIASFSEPTAVVSGDVVLWVKDFTLDAYKNVFKNSRIWVGYRNSIIYTVCGTVLSLVLTIPAAYALSKHILWKRNWIITYFMITMYFSGGLMPTYLTVKDLNLINKPYTLIIIGSFSVYNMVVSKTYFQSSIPDSLYEAAEIDGCSQIRQFFAIAIPLAKPIIAVIALYYAVGRWNEFFNSLIYISEPDYYSLQQVLRDILMVSQTALATLSVGGMSNQEMLELNKQAYMAEAMKYALIFIASLPMLIVYPFIQKYFVKGVMIGAVKG